MHGLFVSDLHLFSDRSVGQKRWDECQPAITSAECVVLGGDIFDFRWSRLGPFKQSLDAAQLWLENAIESNPAARWVFVLGNHDCHPLFRQRLEILASRHRQFEWRASHWRVGNHLFLHGDLLEGRGSPQEWSRYRLKFHETNPKGRLGNVLYTGLVHTRLHGQIPRWRHTPDRTCRRMLTRISRWHPTLLDGVRHVVFGHTHVPLDKWRYESIDFYNPGSAIRHLRFNPVGFKID